MIGVRAATSQHVDIAAGGFSLRGVVKACLDPKLFEGIGRGDGHVTKIVVPEVVCIRSVDNQIVVGTSLSIDINDCLPAPRLGRIRQGGGSTGVQSKEEGEIAGGEWEVVQDVTREHISKRGVRRVHGLGDIGGDLHFCADLSDLQLYAQVGDRGYRNVDIAQHRATKVRRLHGHLVGSRRHQGKDDASVRNGFFGQVGPYSGRKSNLRSSDGCSLRGRIKTVTPATDEQLLLMLQEGVADPHKGSVRTL